MRCGCDRTCPHHGRDFATVADFSVSAGERVSFVLTWHPSHLPAPEPVNAFESLAATEEMWVEWVGRSTYQGEWRDAVVRSLIVLKALTYAPTGGIVAAPTTSLPEDLGGVRNWDYRYCWLRDATMTLLALLAAGYIEEARSWREWLLRAIAGEPSDLQIMYGVAGERMLVESELPWLRWLRGIATGPNRERRRRAVPARRLRRGDQLPRHRTPGRPPAAAARVAHADRTDGLSRRCLAATGRGALGGPRTAAALHPLEGDGVGRVRPDGSAAASRRRTRDPSSVGGQFGTRSTRRCANAPTTRNATRSPRRTTHRISTRRPC